MGVEIVGGGLRFEDFRLEINEWRSRPGVTTVVGANGSGKSTFLKSVLGLIPLDEGRRESSVAEAKLGYVPQNYRQSLLPWQTCSQNFEVIQGIQVDKAQAMLHDLGFHKSDFQKRPSQLSGGQCQRIAIVRELSLDPDLIVFDEPFASLDAKTIVLVSKLIAKFVNLGGTALIASHQELNTHLSHLVTQELTITRQSENLAKLSVCER